MLISFSIASIPATKDPEMAGERLLATKHVTLNIWKLRTSSVVDVLW